MDTPGESSGTAVVTTVPQEPLSGSDLETLVLAQAEFDERQGLYCMGRYGVRGSFNGGRWQPIKSLPDFEGIMKDSARQFIFEAKVCGQSSYDLSGGTHSSFEHQLKHMQRRAAFGALCFVLLHFNARTLKTKAEPAITVVIPIRCDFALWQEYDRGERKRITRLDATEYGYPVEWGLRSTRTTKMTPKIYAAITGLSLAYAAEHKVIT